MKRTILILSAMMSLGVSAQKQWSLEDCINYALENNITLKKAVLSKQSVTEDRKQSSAALLPTVTAGSNHSVGYQPWKDSGISTVTNGTVNTKVDKTSYNGSYNVNANWTVWNGGQNVNRVRLNRLNEEKAGLTVDETANSIQEKIAQLYVQILYQKEAVEVERQNLETSQKNEERGRQMVEVGKMSKAELAQLTAQRASSEYAIVQAQTQVSEYKRQLRQLLEITDVENFDIATLPVSDAQALQEIPSLERVYETALVQRPEIKNAQLAIKSNELELKIAKAGWMPTLSLTGGVNTSTNSLSSNGWGKQMKTNFNLAGGVSLSVPVIDARATRTKVNKAKIAQEQAQLELQHKQIELHSTIESYWLNAVNHQQKFRSASATIESEQASYDLLQEQFQLGLKNIVELMTGRDKLLAAKYQQLQSKYSAVLNCQLLKFYQGEIMKL
jgi:outer membrane protein